jgi:hypothetical protein
MPANLPPQSSCSPLSFSTVLQLAFVYNQWLKAASYGPFRGALLFGTLRQMQHHQFVERQARRKTLAAFAVTFVAFTLAGCGAQYRPVVSAISPVGPAGQPEKFAFAVSSPSATSPGLLTSVDFSGDTVLSTPQILVNPSYFVLNPAGTAGYTINATDNFDYTPLANPTTVLTSQVVQTTLPANSTPISMTALSPASQVATVFIPEPTSPSGPVVTALNAGTAALFETVSVAPNPVYVVGANGTPRVYVISQGAAPGASSGEVDSLEAISTTSLSVSATLPVGITPVYGVMTADDRRAFILNQGSGTVSVINVPNNAFDAASPTITLPSIPLAGGGSVNPAPVWADLSPVNSELVVLNQGDKVHPGTLSIINIPLCNASAQATNPNCDPSNPVDATGFGTIVANATVGIDPTMVSVLQDGSRAYVINSLDGTGTCAAGEGSVSVVNLLTGLVSSTICGVSGTAADADAASAINVPLIFGHPNSVSATTGNPTGKVYVTSGDNKYLSVIYTDTDTVQTHIPLQGTGLRVLVSLP